MHQEILESRLLDQQIQFCIDGNENPSLDLPEFPVLL